ncbi:hypothetical protein LTR85_009234 [Meristemomyces frigidus]|nr:hypothetical protein LTR85_009234 [Meristemomyces frigidus]
MPSYPRDRFSLVLDLPITSIFFPILICGARLFTKHAGVIAQREGSAPAFLGLFFTGTAWAQLSMVIGAVYLDRSELAIGIIVGSALVNVLGTYPIEALSVREPMAAGPCNLHTYALAVLVSTVMLVPLTMIRTDHTVLRRALGAVPLAELVLFAITIGVSLHRRLLLEVPESDLADARRQDGSAATESCMNNAFHSLHDSSQERIPAPTNAQQQHIVESQPLLSPKPTSQTTLGGPSLFRHLGSSLIGFVMVLLSAPILAATSYSLAWNFGISDASFGVAILSPIIAAPPALTTALVGRHGQGVSTVWRNTARSNVNLLTLCLGIVLFIAGASSNQQVSAAINFAELLVLMASTAAFAGHPWLENRLRILLTVLMLGAYVAFLAIELMQIRERDVAGLQSS